MDETQTQQRSMLAGKLVSELQAIAEQVGVKDPKKRKKAELIDAILGTVGGPNGSSSNGGNGAATHVGEAAPAARERGGYAPPSHEAGAANGNGNGAGQSSGSQAGPAGESGNGHSEPAAPPTRRRWEPATPAPAPQAEAPQGSAPQGSAPHGSAPHVEAPHVEASRGDASKSEASHAQGSAPEAAAPAGTGAPTNGDATTGPESKGETAGASSDAAGSVRQGPSQGGQQSSQAPSQGQPSQGQPSQAQPGNQASSQTDTRPEYRRDGQRDGDGTRDRGRRRRRRDRNGNERPERPGEQRIPEQRSQERPERFERPRREPEVEDLSDLEVRTGILDVLPEGYGFLRTSGYLPGQEDVYVSLSQVRRAQLRRGDQIVGAVRKAKEGEKYPALVRIDEVDGMVPDEIIGRKWFEKLTPLYPEERLHMELTEAPGQIAQRIIDLVAPIGKGQRGMIVSPPKAGKTTIMKQIANSITSNNPECHLIVLLVDERPEEVTDMQRSVQGEIVYSTFDRPSEDHIQATELTLDRAKRLVELGKDVVILLDGITRLSRAYNLATPASGRILSGGVDSTALYPPKRFFGAARNIEQGGSLTIIATALVETGSRMDEVIFEEFKGTGNWELRLDRRASEKRIFPAIDIQASGTRKEELLLSGDELSLVWKLRRVLHALEGVAGLELLVDKMRQTKGNMQFLKEIQKVQIGD
jgi:transcription termination factor Rho